MTHSEHKDVYQIIAETVVRSDTQLASEEVKRGAARLDRLHPGWFNKINLRTFQIRNGSECVLGQMYKDEDEYSNESLQKIFRLHLRGKDPNEEDINSRLSKLAVEHGFYSETDSGYTILQAEWEKAIQTRQEEYARLNG